MNLRADRRRQTGLLIATTLLSTSHYSGFSRANVWSYVFCGSAGGFKMTRKRSLFWKVLSATLAQLRCVLLHKSHGLVNQVLWKLQQRFWVVHRLHEANENKERLSHGKRFSSQNAASERQSGRQ